MYSSLNITNVEHSIIKLHGQYILCLCATSDPITSFNFQTFQENHNRKSWYIYCVRIILIAKQHEDWNFHLTFSHWSIHLAWNSWAQGSTRTSWCASKSYMQTTQRVCASPSDCSLKLYDSSWSMSRCAKPCGVSPRLSARFSRACQHHVTMWENITPPTVFMAAFNLCICCSRDW